MSDYTLPDLEIHDRVSVREPREMGHGTVMSITQSTYKPNEKRYWIELDKTYHSGPGRFIKHIQRSRREVIQLQPK